MMPLRSSRNVFIAVTVISILTGCDTGDSRVPSKYGLVEAVANRQIVEQATIMVDLLLPPESAMRLKTTWPPSGYFPAISFARGPRGFSSEFITNTAFDNGVQFTNADTINVFVVDGSMLGQVETAFVPDGDRCVFVNAKSLENLFRSFYMTGQDALQQHNSFDKSLVVALVLLHEIGHLRYGDGGSYGDPARLDLQELNLPSKQIKNREVRADRFATETLQSAWESAEMKGPLGAPYGRAFISSNVFRAIATGFNSFDVTHDPQGILNGRSSANSLRQLGYSHLNLYVRLLVMLQQLEPTDERLRELRWINEALSSPGSSKRRTAE